MQNQPRKTRRTANACVSCRKSRIKCSGNDPCRNCERRGVACQFEEGAKKVMVTERYLKDLQRRASEKRGSMMSQGSSEPPSDPHIEQSQARSPHDGSLPNEQLQDQRIQEESGGSRPDFDTTQSIWTSPFSVPSTTIANTHKNNRNWIWIAPSSTWSFTLRLTLLVTAKLHLEIPFDIPQLRAEDAYPLHWATSGSHGTPDVSGLPSFSHACFLFETVKFYLGQNIRLFDDQAFAANLQELYSGNAAQKAMTSRLWFVQFLLVLAFGNAFLGRLTKDGVPPGYRFFVRAMSLMPDLAFLWKDSLLAIEISALAGLYLYSLDHRDSGHVYIAQAVRVAHCEGLHTELPEDELGARTVQRCRNIWWTIYIIDRHCSLSMGLPISTHHSDISAKLPSPGSCPQQDATFILQIKLYRSLSAILTTVYRSQQVQLPAFLEITRSILHRMAGHAQEIEEIIQTREHESIDTISRDIRHIMLLYHQCVILATRPLLLSLLRGRLELLSPGEGQNWQSFLVQTRPIIAAGIKSAVKTFQLVSAGDGVREVFLPFDLEFTFAAAIYIAMSNALFLPTDKIPTYRQEAQSILDDMITKGNKVAGRRKVELEHLESLLDEVSTRLRLSGLQRLALEDDQGTDMNSEHINYSNREQRPSHKIPSVGDDSEPTELRNCVSEAPLEAQLYDDASTVDNELLDIIGISSGDFMSIVGQIDVADFVDNLDMMDNLSSGSVGGVGENLHHGFHSVHALHEFLD